MIRTDRPRRMPRRRAAVEPLEGRRLLAVAFEPARLAYYGFPAAVRVGDFTGSGRPDLAISTVDDDYNTITHSFLILPNLGNGTFGAPISVPGLPAIYSFMVGDFNGDGHPDVAFPAPDGKGIEVLPGRGDRTFGAPIVSAVTPTSSGYLEVTGTADFNGDGKPDIVYQDTGFGDVGVAPGRGDGTFGPSSLLGQQTDAPAIIGDANGDGKPDLVLKGYNDTLGAYLSIVELGRGDGTFRPVAAIPDAVPLAIGDFNRDGRADLVIQAQDPSNPARTPDFPLAVLPGRGDGTFGSPTYRRPVPSLYQFMEAAVADVNGDGKPGVVASQGLDLKADPAASVAVLSGDGNGTFQLPVELPNGLSAAAYPGAQMHILVADLSGDGKPDVISWRQPIGFVGKQLFPSGVSVLINTSTPQPPVTVSGRLDPASDTGSSHTDGITADTTPTFLGQATPGASIAIFAHRIGSTGTTRVATATAGADGSWRATSSRLPAGAYAITATATLGGKSATAQLLGGSKPLQVVTAPPVVTAVALDPLRGRLTITLASQAPGGLDRAILKDLTAIALSPGFGRNPAPAVTAATLSTPAGPSGSQTLVLTLAGGRRLGPGPYTVVIAGSLIHDVAGNPLDGAFRGSFPSGAGRAGSNFTARFLVGYGRATRPIPLR